MWGIHHIDKVDLLKINCKGCEFFLNNNELKIDRIKIEYVVRGEYKIQNLLKQTQNSGFHCTMYRDSDSKNSGNIARYLYVTRIKE